MGWKARPDSGQQMKGTPSSKKYGKKRSSRRRRRIAKLDPENAPRKDRYRGWWW